MHHTMEVTMHMHTINGAAGEALDRHGDEEGTLTQPDLRRASTGN